MKKILIATSYYLPAYKAGGPIKSIKNLVTLLSKNYTFEILTSNKDIDGKVLEITSENKSEKNQEVFYAKNTLDLIIYIFKTRKHVDLYYLNSFFSFKYSIIFQILNKLNLINKKTILIAPRGELTHGALTIKTKKKMAYLFFFKKILLKKNIKFHFTNQMEALEAINFIGNVPYNIAPNMHDIPSPHMHKNKENGVVNLIYLSRVTEKKNLHTVCHVLSKITSGKIKFTIAGNIENEEYWKHCIGLLEKNKDVVSLNYIGSLHPNEVSFVLQNNHLFFLPTLNENYGHAIVEAMTNSNIVLISKNTPWLLVKNYGGGVFDEYDTESYISFIEKIIKMDSDEFNHITKNIHTYILNELNKNIETIQEVFNE